MSTVSAQMVKALRERSGAGMMECKKALVENHGDIDAAVDWLRKSGLAKADKKASRIAAEGRIVGARKGHDAVMVEINCETDFVAKDASFLKFCDTVADIALQAGATDITTLLAAAYPGASNVAEAAKVLITSVGEKIDVRRVASVHATGAIGSYIHNGRIGVLVALDGNDAELAKGIAMHVAAMNPTYIQAEDVPAEVLAKEKDIALSQMSDNEKHKPPAILEKIISGKMHKIIAEITLLGQPYVLDTSMSVADALKKTGAHVQSVVRLAVGEGIAKPTEDFHAEVMKQAGLG